MPTTTWTVNLLREEFCPSLSMVIQWYALDLETFSSKFKFSNQVYLVGMDSWSICPWTSRVYILNPELKNKKIKKTPKTDFWDLELEFDISVFYLILLSLQLQHNFISKRLDWKGYTHSPITLTINCSIFFCHK